MKTNEVKKGLVASGLSLLMMLTVMAGTSFAWFNQTIVNQGARIQAGTLQVEFLSDADGDFSAGTTNLATSSDPVFQFGTNAQPGDSQSKYLRVKNLGTISLDYEVMFRVVLDTGLAPAVVITIDKVVPDEAVVTRNGTNIAGYKLEHTGAGMAQNAFETYLVTMTFDQSAGNEFQGLSYELDMTLIAWQSAQVASKPIVVSTLGELQAAQTSAVKGSTIVVVENITANTTSIAFTQLINLDLRGNTLSLQSFSVTSTDYGFMVFENGQLNVTNYTIDAPNATLTHATNLTITVSGTTNVSVSNNTYILEGLLQTGSLSILGVSSFEIVGTLQATTLAVAPTASVTPQATSTLIAGAITSGGDKIVPVSGATLSIPENSVTIPVGVTVTQGTMITNVAQLLSAVKSQDPDKDPSIQTTWYIAAGTYDVTREGMDSNKASWFVVREPNLKIIGLGMPTIKAESNAGNGTVFQLSDNTWTNGQNTLTVHADQFFLEGVQVNLMFQSTFISGPGSLEIAGAGAGASGVVTATIQNNKFSGLDLGQFADPSFEGHNYGGQVKINPLITSTKESIQIRNNFFDGAILDLRTPATIIGNSFKTLGEITIPSGTGYNAAFTSNGFAIRFRRHASVAGINYNDVIFSSNTFDIASGTVKIVVEKVSVMEDLYTKLVSLGGFTPVPSGLVPWVQTLVSNNQILAFN
jgi:hypothetical protein